ncbi:hypothetical protein JB92DRAFT_1141836 [Gautieria morchelliformis]|nr:hypothetical protein JB92DRAFT_1141836 [Gautieria morchelliformis]
MRLFRSTTVFLPPTSSLAISTYALTYALLSMTNMRGEAWQWCHWLTGWLASPLHLSCSPWTCRLLYSHPALCLCLAIYIF